MLQIIARASTAHIQKEALLLSYESNLSPSKGLHQVGNAGSENNLRRGCPEVARKVVAVTKNLCGRRIGQLQQNHLY